MRTVTANTQAKLNQDMGTELLILLEVEWTPGGAILYSDQELEGAESKILTISGFDTSMVLEGASDSQELSIALDDTEGTLRDIYNTFDIHKRPARVYTLHKGLALWEKTLVFKGEVVTPIEWDESQRSVSFNILSKLTAKQVGFSMEEGDFPNIPEEALGKAWPLVFGQVCHLPAVKVRAPRRGILQSGVGIKDFTLEPRLCQASKIQCPSNQTGNIATYTQGADNLWNRQVSPSFGPDMECVNRRFGEICKLKDLQEQQAAYEYDTLNIYNGTAFPQGTSITLFIDNARFIGSFSGNDFAVTSRVHPDFDDFDHQVCRNVPAMHYGTVSGVPQIYTDINGNTFSGSVGGHYNYVTITTSTGTKWIRDADGKKIRGAWVPDTTGTYFAPGNQTQGQAMASCDEALRDTPGMVGGPKDSWAYYDEMEASNFFWATPGSEVYMESESEILYIASLLPGTVDGVAAFRVAPNGNRYLTEVPESYYEVFETDYQGYQVVEIGLNKALNLYNDQWEDQLYISFTSSVGPNPCDIIEWLINKYTDLTIDATSFASVHTALTNYPNNFYLTTRPDVYDLIRDIAYQSRCSVYVRNDVMFIKYLSVEPTTVRTLDESDILSRSFVEELSETEDVYTTHNIEWRKAGAAVSSLSEVDHKLILKYNVDKYGTVEEDWDYYTYNIYSLVLKSATFWLIRKANSWKKVKFQTSIKHMDLDIGDCVTLDVAQFGGAVKVIIESMKLNPDTYTVEFVCWTPVRSGETEAYYWAWPSLQAAHQTWPLAGDNNGGGGYNFEVRPPEGHLLLGGAHRDDQLIITSGDLHPSDLDDTMPVVECELSDYLNFNEKPPEIVAKEIAQSAARANIENNMSGGGNPGGGDDEKEDADECGASGAGCNYKVTIFWVKPEAIQKFGGGGPCGCPSPGGGTCYGPSWSTCHTFGSPWMAHSFGIYMLTTYGRGPGEPNYCGVSVVVNYNVADGDHNPIGIETCVKEEVASRTDQPDTDEAEIGEVTNPTGMTGDEPVEQYDIYSTWPGE
jgi:hypothetical protein